MTGLYVRVFTSALTDPRLLGVPAEAVCVWVRGLLVAKEHLTDGLIPDAAMPLLSIGVADREAAIRALVSAGLWKRAGRGYTVGAEKWGKYQQTSEQVEIRRRQWADGQARRRQRNVDVESTLTQPDVNVPEKEKEKEKENKKKKDPPTPRKRGACAQSIEPEGFERFWADWPRKQARRDAEKAWHALAPDAALREVIAQSVDRAKRSRGWLADGGRYIPLPATWLRGERWADVEANAATGTPPAPEPVSTAALPTTGPIREIDHPEIHGLATMWRSNPRPYVGDQLRKLGLDPDDVAARLEPLAMGAANA